MKTLNLITNIKRSVLLIMIMSLAVSTSFASAPAKAKQSIVEIAVSTDDFSILVEALSKAELVDALSGDGPFTVFAPTNKAFENLFTKLGVEGISDLTKDQLTPILLYHVVSGKVMAKSVKTGEVPTLNKDANLMVVASKEGVKINGSSNIVTTDVKATNGVIHIIDAVLVPASPKKASKSSAKGGGCN